LFEGRTADGKPVRLEDCAGKVVLLDFWASWCGPCKQEMPFLTELDSTYRGRGLSILAVNIDKNPKNTGTFLAGLRSKPAFPVLMDGASTIPPLYKLEGMPTTVLIDRKGLIRFRHTGFKPDKRESFRAEIEGLLNEP
jgi:cytochrome c biogenesis protein CcmG, thiol:disulfide interchange protein DsbE